MKRVFSIILMLFFFVVMVSCSFAALRFLASWIWGFFVDVFFTFIAHFFLLYLSFCVFSTALLLNELGKPCISFPYGGVNQCILCKLFFQFISCFIFLKRFKEAVPLKIIKNNLCQSLNINLCLNSFSIYSGLKMILQIQCAFDQNQGRKELIKK